MLIVNVVFSDDQNILVSALVKRKGVTGACNKGRVKMRGSFMPTWETQKAEMSERIEG